MYREHTEPQTLSVEQDTEMLSLMPAALARNGEILALGNFNSATSPAITLISKTLKKWLGHSAGSLPHPEQLMAIFQHGAYPA